MKFKIGDIVQIPGQPDEWSSVIVKVDEIKYHYISIHTSQIEYVDNVSIEYGNETFKLKTDIFQGIEQDKKDILYKEIKSLELNILTVPHGKFKQFLENKLKTTRIEYENSINDLVTNKL